VEPLSDLHEELEAMADENGWVRRCYRVKDLQADCFIGPMTMVDQLGQALREFEALVNSEKNQINQFPDDYELWFVGYSNEKSGVMVGAAHEPMRVAKATQYIRQE